MSDTSCAPQSRRDVCQGVIWTVIAWMAMVVVAVVGWFVDDWVGRIVSLIAMIVFFIVVHYAAYRTWQHQNPGDSGMTYGRLPGDLKWEDANKSTALQGDPPPDVRVEYRE